MAQQSRGSYLIEDDHFWLTETGGEPDAMQVSPSAIVEGRSSLVGVLPDGSSWWRTSRDDWDAPATVACDSWLGVGSSGEPLRRVSSFDYGRPTINPDGTLEMARLYVEPLPHERRHEQGSVRLTLEKWRASPLPLERFDAPANPEHWDDDYRTRMAKRPYLGWEKVWKAPMPWKSQRGTASDSFILRDGAVGLVSAHRKE